MTAPLAVAEPNSWVILLSGSICVALLTLLRRRNPVQSRRTLSRNTLHGTRISILASLVVILSLLLLTMIAACSQRAAAPPSPPLGWADPSTGTVVYVESDGRHAAAIEAEGRLLWHKDVVAEAPPKLQAEGTEPAISALQGPGEPAADVAKQQGKDRHYVVLTLTNGAIVKLDVQTGEAAPK